MIESDVTEELGMAAQAVVGCTRRQNACLGTAPLEQPWRLAWPGAEPRIGLFS